jgi:hypothetical protein
LGRGPCTAQPRSRLLAGGLEALYVAARGVDEGLRVWGDAELEGQLVLLGVDRAKCGRSSVIGGDVWTCAVLHFRPHFKPMLSLFAFSAEKTSSSVCRGHSRDCRCPAEKAPLRRNGAWSHLAWPAPALTAWLCSVSRYVPSFKTPKVPYELRTSSFFTVIYTRNTSSKGISRESHSKVYLLILFHQTARPVANDGIHPQSLPIRTVVSKSTDPFCFLAATIRAACGYIGYASQLMGLMRYPSAAFTLAQWQSSYEICL